MIKKIGILAFHRANNYGAVLQNYALQKSVMKINDNLEICTINYISEQLERPYHIPPYLNIKAKGIKKVLYYMM